VDVTNTVTPVSGFTYAGLETYTVQDSGGNVISSAYYGIYLRRNGAGHAIVADWGFWNPDKQDFDRFVESTPVEASAARLQLVWRAATKTLHIGYSTDNGASFTVVRSYALIGADAPPAYPWSNGMGIELAAVNRTAAPVNAGELTFDNMAVYTPASEADGSGSFFGSDNFAGTELQPGRYTPILTTNGAGWLQTDGQLNFVCDATSPTINNVNPAQQVLVWSSNPDSNTSFEQSWTAEALFSVNTAPVSANGVVILGFIVTPAGLGNPQYGLYILSASSGTRIFTSRANFNGSSGARVTLGTTGALDPQFNPDSVRLRIRYNAAIRTLTSSFSLDDGQTWQDYSSFGTETRMGGNAADAIAATWPELPQQGFGLRLYGSLYGNGQSTGPLLNSGDATVRNLSVSIDTPSIDNWAQSVFTAEQAADPAISSPTADPDGDGIPNFLAYIYGLDPLGNVPPPPNALPSAGTIKDESNQDYLSWTFRRIRNPFIEVTVEASDDFLNWVVIPTRIQSITDNGDGTDTIVVIDISPFPGKESRYMRFNFSER